MRRRGIYYKGSPANSDNDVMRIDAINPVGKKMPDMIEIPKPKKKRGRPAKGE